MKKLITALGSVMLLGTSVSSVVSCSDKPVPSLTSNKIVDKNGKVMGYDISSWDSSVLASDDVKSNYIGNLNTSITTGDNSSSNILKALTTDDGKNEIAVLLESYEAGANENQDVDTITYDDFIASLDFAIYDNQPIKASQDPVATWVDGAWTQTNPDVDLNAKATEDKNGLYNSQSVVTLSFKIEITAKIDGETIPFVGARKNIAEGEDVSKYYTTAIANDEDAIKQASIHTTENGKEVLKASKDGAFDYRYDVTFNFSIS
jgi:hypothetical protein